ncbi:MAG: hypothetical protein GXP48_08420 [Acidobacteria bacterium]|nr:hypothetical protein [Acidobacteriota bacterium]
MTKRCVACFLVMIVPVMVAFSAPPASDAPQPAVAMYHVGVGDVLKVVSYQHREISGEFQVDSGGNITFPLLDKVHVAGLTPTQIAAVLKTKLEKNFYVSIQIEVNVSLYHSKPVTIIGEVGSPGTYYLKGVTTLTGLIAEAGGLKSSAGRKIEVRRTINVNGVPTQKIITVSAHELIGGMGGQLILKSGDIVSVASRQLFFITGEIARPAQYDLQDDETLMQAISQAGGLGKFASQKVEIHRDNGGKKQVIKVNLSRIRQGKQKDPKIKANDVIIVKRRFF